VFYSDDGSTAVETALKLALGYWFHQGHAKRRFVALAGGFHGDTLGAASLCGVDAFVAGTDGTGVPTTFVPLPPATRDDPAFDAAVGALEAALRPGDVAALVVEPIVQGAAGMRIYAPAYLAEARRLCDAHGALLIVDEVFTGYGRSGTMWACDHAAVVPDLMCIAKGFTAGVLPMAATLARQHVFDAFCGDKSRAFHHGHTYAGHPLGAAVAREVLAIYRDEDIVARALPKSARIRDAFARLGDIDGVMATRSIGMIGALELAPAGVAGYLADEGWKVYAEARARGVYLRPLGNVIYITPPLNIGDDDLDELLAIVEASLRAVSSRRS
jgi:adenosylmethionine-8-amino-7-oxononanoate aminotransferase